MWLSCSSRLVCCSGLVFGESCVSLFWIWVIRCLSLLVFLVVLVLLLVLLMVVFFLMYLSGMYFMC